MTTYTTLSNALVAVGAKPFATTVQAFRDNPIAIAEGDVSAPVNSPAWHPYNMVTANDGATGVFYDFAVNGAQATITTPTFVDGYDYMVRWVGISHNDGVVRALQVASVSVTGTVSAATTLTGYLIIELPTLENHPKTAFINVRDTAGSTAIRALDGAAATPFVGYFNFSNLASSLTSISFNFSAGNHDAGQYFLYRRRNYISG